MGGKSCCLTYSFSPCFSRKRSWAPAPSSSSSAAQSSSTADTNEPEASPASSSDALNKLLSGLPEVKQAKGRSSCFDASVRYPCLSASVNTVRYPVLWICIGFNADPEPGQTFTSQKVVFLDEKYTLCWQ